MNLEPERRAEEERYTLGEVADKLRIARSTLTDWLKRAGLRKIVESQVDEDGDLRARYLTRSQLERLAKRHHREIADSTAQTGRQKITPSLEERMAALERQIAELTGKLEKLSRLAKSPHRRPQRAYRMKR